MRDWWHGKLVFILLVLILAPGRIVVQGQVTEETIKRCRSLAKPLKGSNWWDYYERGRAYAEDRCWLEAAQDFKAAIAQRPQDTRHAKTKGFTFIEYFPHRELGIAYYHLSCYPEATLELESSLQHIPQQNERAETFLSEVNNAQSTALAPCQVTLAPLTDQKWWNYYERGKAYANGQCWLEAAQDFKAAIAQRHHEGYQVKTYGLHFLDEYLPHRELGIAYYHLKCYAMAIRELETSLEQVVQKDNRAQEFLNRARNGNAS